MLVVILALSLLGLAIAVELSRIHYFTHTDPTYHSVCAINEQVNCETVAQSTYSIFLGLPISVWGMLAYTLFTVLCVWGLTGLRLHNLWSRGVLFWLFIAAFVSSGLLAYLSFFRIDSMCLFCMSLYTLNLIFLITGIVLMAVSKTNPVTALISDVRAILGKPVVLLICLLLAGGAVGGLQVLVPKYWVHMNLTDLPDLPKGVDDEGGHWTGAKVPLVIVTEFSDYECPFCRKAYRNARSWCAEYPDQVRLVHRQMPLDQSCNPSVKRKFHDRACEFAKAAECAAEQDQFWKMSDALFSIQDTVTVSDVNVETLAVQLGLDRSSFVDCMKSDRVMRQIRKDLRAAKRRKISGTPTFFINSQMYVGGFSRDVLRNSVEDARARASSKK